MSTPAPRHSCAIQLLRDVPADHDDLGTAGVLAAAVVRILTTNSGGRTIGLEGRWVSGKSTVVRLVGDLLAANPHHLMIVFDAWAHVGDPLRRSFLETLIDAVNEQGWLTDSTRWTDRKAALAGRRIQIREKRTPYLSGWGKAFGLSLALVPLGLAILNSALRGDVTLVPRFDLAPHYPLLAGLIVAGLPVILTLTSWAFSRGDRDSDVWGLLIRASDTDVSIHRSESGDPTSLEFETEFRELLDACLDNDARRAVIVIDNLDRISPDDALAVISTLRIFLQLSEHRAPAWIERVWFLVPYDPTALARLWDASSQASPEAEQFAESFLRKTFQLRLSVPPPALSNWRQYMLRLLDQSLPAHTEEASHKIYHIFDATFRTTPTPRDIVLFVNRLAALHLADQWSLPLVDVAYYCTLLTTHTDIAAGLKSGQLPPASLAHLVTPNVRDSLASLIFLAPPSTATQLLLGDDLLAALGAGDFDRITQLKEYGDGFWAVLEQLDPAVWHPSDSPSLARAASCLRKLTLAAPDHAAESAHPINKLALAALRVDRWAPLDRSVAEGLVALLEMAGSPELEATLLSRLPAAPSDDEADFSPEDTLRWAEGLTFIVRALSAIGHMPATQKVAVGRSTTTCLQLCRALAEADPSRASWATFRVDLPDSVLTEALERAASVGEDGNDLIIAARFLLEVHANVDWRTLAETISTEIRELRPTPEQFVSELRLIWLLIHHNPSFVSPLKQICDGGYVLHYLHKVSSLPDLAWLLLTYIHFRPALDAAVGVGDSRPGYNKLQELLSHDNSELAEFILGGAWVVGALQSITALLDFDSATQPLLRECLIRATRTEYAPSAYTPELVLQHWHTLLRVLPTESRRALLSQLIHKADFLSSLSKRALSSNDLQLLLDVGNSGGATMSSFLDLSTSCLHGIPRAQWPVLLATDSTLADLLSLLYPAGRVTTFGPHIHDSLLYHLNATLSGTPLPPQIDASRPTLLALLDRPQLKAFRTKLVSLAPAFIVAGASSIFTAFGNEMVDEEALSADPLAVQRLFSAIVDQPSDDSIGWLRTVIAEIPHVVSNGPAYLLDDFRNRLRRAIAEHSANGTVLEHLQAISSRLSGTPNN